MLQNREQLFVFSPFPTQNIIENSAHADDNILSCCVFPGQPEETKKRNAKREVHLFSRICLELTRFFKDVHHFLSLLDIVWAALIIVNLT